MATLGGVLGWLSGSLLRIRRREVEARIAKAGIERPASVARGMYRSLGIGLCELVAVSFAPVSMGAKVHLTERAERALADASSGGCVVATAHVGNWDLLACAMAARYRLSVVTKRLHLRHLDRLWQTIRGARGLGLIDARGAVTASIARVRAGETVAMMIDQAPAFRENALRFDFLGQPAFHDPSPATVAARTRRPLVIAFSRRLVSGHHVLDVEQVLSPLGKSAQVFIAEATMAASRALEDVIRREPSSWMWLHRRWKDLPSRRGLASPRVVRAAP